MRARGGIGVDITWTNGELQSAEFRVDGSSAVVVELPACVDIRLIDDREKPVPLIAIASAEARQRWQWRATGGGRYRLLAGGMRSAECR